LISLGILSSSNTGETGKTELKPFFTIFGTRMRALLADGIISYVDPNSQMFSLGAVKGIVGFVLVVLSASYFKESKE
jgi:hypothetical protein